MKFSITEKYQPPKDAENAERDLPAKYTKKTKKREKELKIY